MYQSWAGFSLGVTSSVRSSLDVNRWRPRLLGFALLRHFMTNNSVPLESKKAFFIVISKRPSNLVFGIPSWCYAMSRLFF